MNRRAHGTENRTLFVNVYREEQCYGGPEEGGWFYNSGEFLYCGGMYRDPGTDWRFGGRAPRVAQIITKRHEDYKPTYHMGKGPHDGVDSEGHGDDHYLLQGGAWGDDKVTVLIEEHMGRDYPKYRPHYE